MIERLRSILQHPRPRAVVEGLRSVLFSFTLVRLFVRLMPWGPTVDVSGYDECRIPVSLVPHIVDNIDPRAIHPGSTMLRVDGGRLHDLAKGPLAGLTLRERVALRDAGGIGLESAAMTFRGDVLIETLDAALVARAQRRGAGTGFAESGTIMALAELAAAHSGRPNSGAPREVLSF